MVLRVEVKSTQVGVSVLTAWIPWRHRAPRQNFAVPPRGYFPHRLLRVIRVPAIFRWNTFQFTCERGTIPDVDGIRWRMPAGGGVQGRPGELVSVIPSWNDRSTNSRSWDEKKFKNDGQSVGSAGSRAGGEGIVVGFAGTG